MKNIISTVITLIQVNAPETLLTIVNVNAMKEANNISVLLQN